ncbi:Uncharacterised protein [Bacillus freudenreichii]|nr:Uncharacterised protein [Bacillus freudenreichii]
MNKRKRLFIDVLTGPKYGNALISVGQQDDFRGGSTSATTGKLLTSMSSCETSLNLLRAVLRQGEQDFFEKLPTLCEKVSFPSSNMLRSRSTGDA